MTASQASLPGRGTGAAIVCVCCLSMFMIAVDTTVVNLALPLAIFTLASAGCSIAPGTGWLIAFRALQGAGGSALTPMSMGILTAAFSDPAARARALGLWSGTFGVGMAAGPALGGLLAAAWGWRSLFWIAIAPGLIATFVAGLVIPDSWAARPRRLDPPGQVLVIAWLACLTYGIIEGPAAGWRSLHILGVFAVSAAALVLLTGWERRRADPLIELRVFRSAAFTGASAITVCASACLGGFLFLTALYLQDVRGLTVWQAGVQLLPLAAAAALAGPAAGRTMARRGARGPLTVAGVALPVSCLLLAQVPPKAPWESLAAAYAVFGVGYGAVNTVIAAVAVAGMPRAQAGVAGGMTSAGRQVGQSLGVPAAGSILASRLRGPDPASFAAACHPAWLLIAACGVAVLMLSLASTSRRAGRHYVGRHRRHPAGRRRPVPHHWGQDPDWHHRARSHQQGGEQHPLPSRRYTDNRIPPYEPATVPAGRTAYRPPVQLTPPSASAEPATTPMPRLCQGTQRPAPRSSPYAAQ